MLQSLRVVIALAFGACALAIVAALTWGLGAAAVSASLRDRGDALHALARSSAAMLAEGVTERLNEVEWLAAAPPTQGWASVLRRLQANRPQYSWIGVADREGRVLEASGGLLVGASVAARPWFQRALAGPHVGDVHTAKLLASLLPAPANGEPLRFIDFAAPVRGADGNVRAVLGVHAPWDWAQSVVDALQTRALREAGVQVFIVDRVGQVILHPPGLQRSGGAVPLGALPAAGAGTATWSDGIDYLTAAAPLPPRPGTGELGWTLVARQPVPAALASAHAARNAAFGLGVGAAGLASLVAWLLAGNVSRPLTRIAEAAQALQHGRLDTEIPRTGGAREIRDLGSTLHAMTQTLLQRERELEHRVQARTRELLRSGAALQRANAELLALATRDALTGLANRRAGDERLRMEYQRHRRSARPLALVVADIDHFKSVNDRHGHAAGDLVLHTVAQTLAGACRETDFVARWGGEEFLLLLPETNRDGAVAACEKLRAAVAAARPPGGLTVTLSLGVSVMGDGGGMPALDAALRAADEALYAAKDAGRNRVQLAAACAAEEAA